VAELWLRLGGCDYDCWDAGGWGRQGVGAKKGCALLLGWVVRAAEKLPGARAGKV